MQEDIQTETKKSSKEMWLFLIFIDVVALCVFGFFIYNSFFGNIGGAKAEAAAEPFLEEVVVEDIKTVEEPVLKKEEPKKEEAKPAPVKEEKAAAEAPKAEAKPEPAAQKQAEPAVKKAEPKRKSVFVSGSGKTRQVTFKYFGNAKKVAVVGGFTMRRPVAMKKSGGVWSTTLTLYPGEYKYMYIVDGKEIADPNAEGEDGRSEFTVK